MYGREEREAVEIVGERRIAVEIVGERRFGVLVLEFRVGASIVEKGAL